jgi:ribosomal protein S18 acetylase RimI-like enzyme
MSHSVKDVTFQIEAATESDWPWIMQGLVETAWVMLGTERQQEVSRRTVEERVTQHVVRLRQDEGFPSQAFVAKSDNEALIGFVWVAMDHNDSTGELEATLLSQYVVEGYRGQGLGHRLLETAENWARQQGLPRISLSVGVSNRLAQRLYQSLGYQIETLRMTKTLGTSESES